ncbi:MAG: GntR family transcriptional regulator [Gemmiger sp.]|nr:GntR family transcriptional regulator [Gemmiger sp.]
MDTNLVVTPMLDTENNRQYACRVLRTNIMTLKLRPGQPLSEGELAELLHMSRTPIHEAITALKEEWLIEIYPQRGTQVSRIDPALVKEGYSTRLLLEGALLKDEAGKIGREQVQLLVDCLRKQEALCERMPETVAEFIQLDDEFHRMMYFFGGAQPHLDGNAGPCFPLRPDALFGCFERRGGLCPHLPPAPRILRLPADGPAR